MQGLLLHSPLQHLISVSCTQLKHNNDIVALSTLFKIMK